MYIALMATPRWKPNTRVRACHRCRGPEAIDRLRLSKGLICLKAFPTELRTRRSNTSRPQLRPVLAYGAHSSPEPVVCQRLHRDGLAVTILCVVAFEVRQDVAQVSWMPSSGHRLRPSQGPGFAQGNERQQLEDTL